MTDSVSRSSAASNDDIVGRLREKAFRRTGPTMEAVHAKSLEWQAADEIERLRHDLDRHMQIAVDVLNPVQPSAASDRRVYFACESCSEHEPESGVHCRSDIAVMPDGTWLCDNCYSDCDKSAYGLVAGNDDFLFPLFEDLPRPPPYTVAVAQPSAASAAEAKLRHAMKLARDYLVEESETDSVWSSRENAQAVLAIDAAEDALTVALAQPSADIQERIAELQYEAGMYQALYENAAAQIRASIKTDCSSADSYQNVIDEALVVRHLGVAKGNARDELNQILSWEVAVALDPRVSEAARKLIEQGVAIRSAMPRPHREGGRLTFCETCNGNTMHRRTEIVGGVQMFECSRCALSSHHQSGAADE